MALALRQRVCEGVLYLGDVSSLEVGFEVIEIIRRTKTNRALAVP
jgi:hypothetical protein